jgi:hypothetical protein
MWKWILFAGAMVGVWYGMPVLWAGCQDVMHHRITLGEWHPTWLHFFTFIGLVCVLKVKGK